MVIVVIIIFCVHLWEIFIGMWHHYLLVLIKLMMVFKHLIVIILIELWLSLYDGGGLLKFIGLFLNFSNVRLLMISILLIIMLMINDYTRVILINESPILLLNFLYLILPLLFFHYLHNLYHFFLCQVLWPILSS